MVVTTNGTRKKALEKLPDLRLCIRDIIIPTNFQLFLWYLDKYIEVSIYQAREDQLEIPSKISSND
ncbi:3730_t:CDS:2, partial [Racocetra persica]